MKPTGKCFFHECCQEARDQDKTRYVPSCALEKIVMADFGKHVESCFSVTKTLHIHCHHAYGHQNWHSGDLSWGTNTHKVLTRVRIIKRCQNSFNHFIWDRTQLISILLISCTPKIVCKRKGLQLLLKTSTKNGTKTFSK